MAEDETSTPDTQGAESAFHLMDGLRSNLKDAEKGISRQLILHDGRDHSAYFRIMDTSSRDRLHRAGDGPRPAHPA